MATFSKAPKLTKGAIVGFDIMNPLASVIIFQYNPNQVTRQVQARTAGSDSSPQETLRLTGAPQETITLNEVVLDATDQLEQSDPIATSMGVYPQLSALEMLLYPKSVTVIANTALMLAGTIEIVQPVAPFTLFIWGIKRVLPVRLSSFNITEERFDPDLNPIAAKMNLTLNVLSTNDFSVTHPGYYTFLTHQVVKETMAVIGSVSNVSSVAGGDISIL
ncbi:MAG: hypothetical protein QNJ45_17755 [Ardenticatenaceae bacterium]|nr:hypothetical protein [Ardenticatenaceae bacterium]